MQTQKSEVTPHDLTGGVAQPIAQKHTTITQPQKPGLSKNGGIITRPLLPQPRTKERQKTQNINQQDVQK
jgi:hypothetical protein